MSQEILSVAVWEPVPDMEAASLATIRELIAILSAKGYSRDASVRRICFSHAQPAVRLYLFV